MTLADELTRLEQLRDRGTLSEEEFTRAKARTLDARADEPKTAAINSLRRSRSDRWIGGVCGGLSAMLGLEAWIVRRSLSPRTMPNFSVTGGTRALSSWMRLSEPSMQTIANWL